LISNETSDSFVEEPVVIKMLDSMLSTKKTVGYRQELNEMLPKPEILYS
jgi:hypothetical protein